MATRFLKASKYVLPSVRFLHSNTPPRLPIPPSTPPLNPPSITTAAHAFDLDYEEPKITETLSRTTLPPPPPPPPRGPILNLDDEEKLFATVSTGKLLRSSIILQMAAVEPLVDFGTWVMNSRVMDSLVGRGIVLGVVKHTFYEHFCGGEDVQEAVETVKKKINGVGLRGMLDYALEDAEDNLSCDKNLEEFLRTVDATKLVPPSSMSFVVLKISAIFPIYLLRRVSDLLRWQHKNPSFILPWKNNDFPLFADSSPMYHTLEQPDPLTSQEEQDLELGLKRLRKLCQRCQEADVPLAIDAEYTSVQPAIDYFTYYSSILYNKSKPLVYGTMQAYLKDSKDRLLLAMQEAEKMGVTLGYKLVRGAYMTSESKLAHSLGYESPIHNSIQDTHSCYNECASFLLEKIATKSAGAIIATHNFESGRLATAKAVDLGMKRDNPRLEFAQLYGMAEAFTFGLRNAGFQVSKYIPFGHVEKVIPYLLRRAEENRGMLSTSSMDRRLMRKELGRRLNVFKIREGCDLKREMDSERYGYTFQGHYGAIKGGD